jgi:hypothetical protein
MKINGYEIAYKIVEGDKVLVETLNKEKAVATLVAHPGAECRTRAL